VTPAEAVKNARSGLLLPVYVIAGEEQFFRDEVVSELRAAALKGGVAALNEDRFTAGEVNVDAVIAAARTVPMMSPRRFVLVRGAERWESDGTSPALPGRGQHLTDEPTTPRSSAREETAASAFDRLAEYAAAPVASTCLALVASKFDRRRRLATLARKENFLVACEPLDSRSLAAWIADRCRLEGNPVTREVADLLAALVGPQLSSVSDAIERLSIYVGAGAPIDEGAVSACVARVRTGDSWALVDAVGARDLGRAMRTLADVYDSRDRGLPLLGALAWSIRQLARFQAGVAAGEPPDAAARRAGVFIPHRVRELSAKARAVRPSQVEQWMLVLAEADLALKSSRRSADEILAEMLTRLCSAEGVESRAPPRRSV